MNEAWPSIVGVVSLMIGLAIVAVLVSRKSSTATVISSFSTALDKLLLRSTGSAT